LCLRRALEAIVAQEAPCPIEIVVVDDHSDDGSLALVRRLSKSWPLRVVSAETRGAAAALNTGVRAARYPIICQVDQDVMIGPSWLSALLNELDDPDVAAVQGYYVTDPAADWAARAMGLDLEQRYGAIGGSSTDHVCTGNAAYRADALHRAGLFDERFGYGYDNDMSYRLRAAGHRLVLCREARSTHQWREGLRAAGQRGWLRTARSRCEASAPVRRRCRLAAPMMAHALLMAMALACLTPAARWRSSRVRGCRSLQRPARSSASRDRAARAAARASDFAIAALPCRFIWRGSRGSRP
jgi:GT2 family glycosyltransferase